MSAVEMNPRNMRTWPCGLRWGWWYLSFAHGAFWTLLIWGIFR